jgi:diadenosine tetraphosphate (Ap4A) HIT family hydrolase
MHDCIFCKIVKGEIDSAKVWEDENYLAILDINPNTKGVTLVLPKKHFDSDAFDMPENDYLQLLKVTKKVAQLLEKGLKVQRVAMVMEGLGINHTHIKLYPLHGLNKKFTEMWAKDKIYFDKYEGYISTQLGPKVEMTDLKTLADEIKNDK